MEEKVEEKNSVLQDDDFALVLSITLHRAIATRDDGIWRECEDLVDAFAGAAGLAGFEEAIGDIRGFSPALSIALAAYELHRSERSDDDKRREACKRFFDISMRIIGEIRVTKGWGELR